MSDPILHELDWILDDPKLFALVRHDLAQHYKPTKTGRHHLAVEVTLRITILRRRKNLERVIRPRTLHQINERVLVMARTYRLTQGYKLRVDSSVTETNIRYPLDNGLLLDGVRVLSRLLQRAAVPAPTSETVRTRAPRAGG